MFKSYLGDAVYAEFDDCSRLVLTTEDGIRTTNIIILDPEVFNALLDYVKSIEIHWDIEGMENDAKYNK